MNQVQTPVKISICIPQYNRSAYLVASLKYIEQQTYEHIEVVISDDCSTDDTEAVIQSIQKSYRYPIIYHRFQENAGYDRNTRKSLELATGQYCFILGNDDTLNKKDDIAFLVNFLQENGYPEIGFCNSCEYINENEVQARASSNSVIGSSEAIALNYYSSFSFIAGIIMKRASFMAINTDKADKSIYFQLYLCTLLILKGGRLFTIERPLVKSHIYIGGKEANSYKDTLPHSWKDFKTLDGGLPNFSYVTMMAFEDAGLNAQHAYYKMIQRIYSRTYPYWLLNYRMNNSFIGAVGLVKGLQLKVFKRIANIPVLKRIQLMGYYLFFSLAGLITPIFLFKKFQQKLYLSGKA